MTLSFCENPISMTVWRYEETSGTVHLGRLAQVHAMLKHMLQELGRLGMVWFYACPCPHCGYRTLYDLNPILQGLWRKTKPEEQWISWNFNMVLNEHQRQSLTVLLVTAGNLEFPTLDGGQMVVMQVRLPLVWSRPDPGALIHPDPGAHGLTRTRGQAHPDPGAHGLTRTRGQAHPDPGTRGLTGPGARLTRIQGPAAPPGPGARLTRIQGPAASPGPGARPTRIQGPVAPPGPGARPTRIQGPAAPPGPGARPTRIQGPAAQPGPGSLSVAQRPIRGQARNVCLVAMATKQAFPPVRSRCPLSAATPPTPRHWRTLARLRGLGAAILRLGAGLRVAYPPLRRSRWRCPVAGPMPPLLGVPWAIGTLGGVAGPMPPLPGVPGAIGTRGGVAGPIGTPGGRGQAHAAAPRGAWGDRTPGGVAGPLPPLPGVSGAEAFRALGTSGEPAPIAGNHWGSAPVIGSRDAGCCEPKARKA
ncbi:hypothetical protein QTO34_014328, partial [Cnephaeus nilssonii]